MRYVRAISTLLPVSAWSASVASTAIRLRDIGLLVAQIDADARSEGASGPCKPEPVAGRIASIPVQLTPALWQTGPAAIGSAMLSRRAQRLWLFGILIWVTLALLSAAQNATWRALNG